MRTIVFPLAVIAALVQVGEAQDQTRSFTAYGPATKSCGVFRNVTGTQKQTYEWWVLGFVSGAGFVYSQDNRAFGETDSAGIKSWIDTYCADHPIDSLPTAALELVDELQQRAATR
jgi:hypothetical protein